MMSPADIAQMALEFTPRSNNSFLNSLLLSFYATLPFMITNTGTTIYYLINCARLTKVNAAKWANEINEANPEKQSPK